MRRRELLHRSTSALCCALMAATGGSALSAQAQTSASPGAELARLEAQYEEGTVSLSYEVQLSLLKDVEQMLMKGVAMVFVARASVYEKRWYWTDKRVASATRRWRVVFQPLTRHWRVNFDGFSRSYSSLEQVLDVMRHGTQWPIHDRPLDIDPRDCYVDFSFKLDADELPRPLQIGLGGQDGWAIQIERRVGVKP